MDFVAIDFETANAKRNSACSLAAISVADGTIAREAYSLIRPPEMRFDAKNIDIHGITPQMVAEKPTFDQLWDRIRLHLEGQWVLAHNAAFDISVLRNMLETYALPLPQMQHLCTVKLARRVWPGLASYRLSALADQFGIQFCHHNALQDARTCAQIVLLAQQEAGVATLPELSRCTGVKPKAFN
ncbi:3'-5' exonuclease [Azotosporobacter soli]|uniref:3'-5' exonuclease n=1 Tax=Azotosporobacter soli TaxID=3055040 RepID=UPI0031FF2D65